jgi:hypothetical protein
VDAATPLNIYVTGFTYSADFPVSSNALITAPGPGGTSANGSGFVTKLTPSLTGTAQLTYSTYLGGDTEDQGNGIAADASGDAFVTGLTLSTNFPTTTNAYSTTALNPTNGGAFLTEINTVTGTDVYSTYFGGTNGAGNAFLFGDEAFGITVDASSNAYIVGTATSSDFPTAGHTVSSCSTDANGIAFVSVINTTTPALTYSTCLGGASTETQGQAVALGPAGIAYVVGQTTSSDFPVTAGSIPAPAIGVGNGVVFLSLLNTTSATPNTYSTFLGGSNGDFPYGIAADATGNAYVAGSTGSGDFPITPGALIQSRNNANGTGFVSKINPGGNGQADLVYSSYFGGNGTNGTFDAAYGIGLSGSNAYIAGQTASSDLPVTTGAYQTTFNSTAGTNAFVADFPLVPVISISPISIPFGTQLVGTPTTAQIVTITNNSTTSIPLALPPTFAPSTPPVFAQSGGTCAASLAAGETCTVGVTFTPATATAYSATMKIFYTYNGVLSTVPLQVALTGTGSNTGSVLGIAPTSLTFAGQLLTTTSAAQMVTLTNNGNAILNFTAVPTTSSSFTNTTTCGTTLAVSASCTVSVTFAPTSGAGALTGTLTLTDDANGSPQSVALTGTAWDFSVLAPSSVNVARGAMGTFPVTVTGLGGFTGAVSFTCTPGSVLVTACAVPTTNAAAAPGAMATGTLTAASFVVAPESIKVPPPASLKQVLPVMLAIALLCMFASTRKYRTRVGMAGAMLVFIMVAGCSGNRPKTKTTTLTITPSSGGVTKPAITVTVNIT